MVYVFVGYFTILGCIVALFCVCFVRCNCTSTQCCNSSFCFRLKCSPQILRKQRFKIKCPSSVATKVDTLQTFTAEKCCLCCSDIDQCDSDELAFWTEMVILTILCLPFAICLLVLYAYAKSKWKYSVILIIIFFILWVSIISFILCAMIYTTFGITISMLLPVGYPWRHWSVYMCAFRNAGPCIYISITFMCNMALLMKLLNKHHCQGILLTEASNGIALYVHEFQ